MRSSSEQSSDYDLTFKILLIGDFGVGKSSLLQGCTSSSEENPANTDGVVRVDIKVKHMTVGGKKVKLTFWDIVGEERSDKLLSSYYENAQGIILVYDVTHGETLTNLKNKWTKEAELHCTNKECVKILVGNKVDKGSERKVNTDEGKAAAKELKSLFIECSAETKENVDKCFEKLAVKIMEGEKKNNLVPEPVVVAAVQEPVVVAAVVMAAALVAAIVPMAAMPATAVAMAATMVRLWRWW